MTDFRGIAAVTHVLGYLLGSAARAAVPEVNVTYKRPEEPAAAAVNEPRLNIYLVQVVPDANLRSSDLPTRDQTNGQLVNVPRAPLILRYLITYFGASHQAQLMLGADEVALREQPTLDPTLIEQALDGHHHLQGTGLEQQLPPPRIVPSSTTLEELARFWSGFLQMPYTLSTIQDVGPVILSPNKQPATAPPVAALKTKPGAPAPQLDALPTVPFAPGHLVPLTGTNLNPTHHIQIAGRWHPLEPQPDGTLAFMLPPDVAAGHNQIQLGTNHEPIPGSRPATLSVRPDVTAVAFDDDDGSIHVTVRPPVQPGQHVALGLSSPADSVQIETTATREQSALRFRATRKLPPGPYLATVAVDGVTSLPHADHDRYTGPLVRLP